MLPGSKLGEDCTHTSRVRILVVAVQREQGMAAPTAHHHRVMPSLSLISNTGGLLDVEYACN